MRSGRGLGGKADYQFLKDEEKVGDGRCTRCSAGVFDTRHHRVFGPCEPLMKKQRRLWRVVEREPFSCSVASEEMWTKLLHTEAGVKAVLKFWKSTEAWIAGEAARAEREEKEAVALMGWLQEFVGMTEAGGDLY